MTSTALVVHESADLALEAEQTYWTSPQISALQHIGVENASDGDLQVFFHVCKRTGLDPFARQIHMIGRKSREQLPNGEWGYVTKQTIQTGIDGFRLIGRRAANSSHQKVSVSAPEWAHPEGGWREVWMGGWGHPVAARVTIHRDGEPFTAVALFDEYKQTKRNGELTSMWTQRPAGQLAKCAEALAWRMAFPQDLSGIYADDEMGQADNQTHHTVTVEPTASAADRMRSVLDPQTSGAEAAPDESTAASVEPDTTSAPEPLLLNTRSALAKAMYAAINEAGITDKERLPFIASVIGRPIESSKEMTEDEARQVLDHLAEVMAPDAPVDAELVEDGDR